ncbi:MAG: hypothetical protein ABFS46_14075 [Myxococcota bacterium]
MQWPGETDAIGERRERVRQGLAPAARYDDILPADYWEPAARLKKLDELRVDEAALFPNYGLAWERTLDGDRPSLLSNLGAWNRWRGGLAPPALVPAEAEPQTGARPRAGGRPAPTISAPRDVARLFRATLASFGELNEVRKE